MEIGAVIAPAVPPLTSSFFPHTETKDKVSPAVREISGDNQSFQNHHARAEWLHLLKESLDQRRARGEA